MNRLICFGAMLAAIAAITTGCPGPGPAPEPDAALDITYNGTVNNSLSVSGIAVEGRSFEISVSANRDWKMTPLAATIDWVTVSPQNGVKNNTAAVDIVVKPNSGAVRNVDIVFSTDDGAVSRTVKLAQLGMPEKEVIPANFTSAEMDYYGDYYRSGTGNFDILFRGGDEAEGIYTSLYLDFSSDYFEDFFQAVPTNGTYKYAENYAKFTFEDSEFVYINEAEDLYEKLYATGGSFTLTRKGSGYVVDIDLEMDNSKVLKGMYEGDIAYYYEPTITSDVTVDFSNPWSTDVEAYEMTDGLWAIEMWVEDENDDEEYVGLSINTETGLTDLPTGNYPMAAEAGKGVAGTAEPIYISEDWRAGCFYAYNERLGTYSVPGKGFVNIGREGDVYTIGFSFEGPNGYTVSGNYTGYVDVYDEDDYYTRAQTRSQVKSQKFRALKKFENK